MKRIFLVIMAAACLLAANAADPTATNYTATQCQGSAMPYPSGRKPAVYPDSLTPVFINCLCRHGARFPSSDKSVERLRTALERAASEGTITAQGRDMLALCKRVEATVGGNWGALDTLGMAEQRALAARMFVGFKDLLGGSDVRVEAISSYSPRCIMSMYSFTHQLARYNNKIEIATSSGHQYSYLLRPFSIDAEYKAYREADAWKQTLDAFRAQDVPLEPIARVLGKIADYEPDELRALAMDEYAVVAGCAAAGIAVDSGRYFTLAEYNRLWAAANMRHYLLYSSNTISTIPADIASALLMNITGTTEAAANGDGTMPQLMMRYGHAETIMPLVALLRLKGGYYMTNYFETVAQHWADFNLVPMCANLQFILFRAKSGNMYLRVDLNEEPVALIPGTTDIYIPWTRAREYMNRCIPIFYQP